MGKNDRRNKKYKRRIKVAIVGKYVQLEDSYLSLMESIKHAGYKNKVKVEINLIDSKKISDANVIELLGKAQAIVVSGGYGEEVLEGELVAIKYARENKLPYLGICLGMQMSVMEYARNVLDMKEDESLTTRKKAQMRIGEYETKLKDETIAKEMYKKEVISERHRHEYEINDEYKEKLEEAGLICSGSSNDGSLIDIVEISRKEHPYYIATIYHPEYKSRPNIPAALFIGLIEAAKIKSGTENF